MSENGDQWTVDRPRPQLLQRHVGFLTPSQQYTVLGLHLLTH